MERNCSFVITRTRTSNGATYQVKALDKCFLIYPDDFIDNSKEMSFEKLSFPEFNTSDAIIQEITEEITREFGEVASTIVLHCDEQTKKAIYKMAATNSILFE